MTTAEATALAEELSRYWDGDLPQANYWAHAALTRRGGVREAWTRSLYFLTQELTPSEQPPFTAVATYTLVYQRRGTELGRELWSAEIRFHFLDGVPSEYVLVKPIGLSVSYLRADRAVSES